MIGSSDASESIGRSAWSRRFGCDEVTNRRIAILAAGSIVVVGLMLSLSGRLFSPPAPRTLSSPDRSGPHAPDAVAPSPRSEPAADSDSLSLAADAAVADPPSIAGGSDPQPDRDARAWPSNQELMRMPNFERRQHFDRRPLRAAGLSEQEIDALYERWSEAEREIHLAIAENHAAGIRLRPGPLSYDAALRESLDDDDFDAALYATGQQNRVLLREPADGGRLMADGLQPGDFIESYDGERIFRLVDLQLLMKETSEDESIPLVVRRGDEFIELMVPGRHPLGPKSPGRAPPPL